MESISKIVVPYSHCCGSTRRAINAVYLEEYFAHPQWQVFNDPDLCAMMGACQDDSQVTSATCDGAPDGMCVLVFP